MHIGNRAESYNRSKNCIARHNKHTSKRSANGMEKAEKTRVRREGKKLCQERD